MVALLMFPPVGMTGGPPPAARSATWRGGGPLETRVPSFAPIAASQRPSVPPNATWQPIGSLGPAGPPGGLTGAAIAWDPRDGYLVLFGGNTSHGVSDATWTFQPGGWTNRTNASDAPPAVFGASLEFDYALDAVVLFGGCGPSACPSATTWLYDGGIWANVTNRSIDQPPARYDAALGFANDSADHASVLFGGCLDAACSRRANDTWELNTTVGWVPETLPSSPPATSGAVAAYDPSLGGLVLFGGRAGPGGSATSATWLFEGGLWTDLGSSVAGPTPPADADPAATFQASTGQLLVITGAAGGPGFSWTLTCASACRWSNASGALGAGAGLPSNGAALASESGTILPFLVGGSGAGEGAATPAAWALEPALTLEAAVTPSVAPARSPVEGSSNATGGTPPYSFRWTVGTEGTAAENVSLAFPSPGVYDITVIATDQYDVEAVVNLTERATGPSVSATGSPGTVDEGIPVHFLAAAPTGGTAPYNFTWQWPGGTGSYGSAVDHSFATNGTQSVGIVVTDARGVTNSSELEILVVVPPAVTIGSPRAATDVGGTVELSAVVVGGVAPVTYNWTLDDGTANGSGPQISVRYPYSGQFPVEVRATDAVGATTTAETNVTVNAALGLEVQEALMGTAWGSVSSVANGTSLSFRALPENGTPGYSIAWQLTAPNGSLLRNTGAEWNFTPERTGEYVGVVTVTDATGALANATFQFQSQASSPVTCTDCGGAPISWVWDVVVAAALILAAAGGLFAALRVRRPDRPR